METKINKLTTKACKTVQLKIYSPSLEPFYHRIRTARKEKGWRQHFFYQIEPNCWNENYRIP